MALIRTTVEQREVLKVLHDAYGSNIFQQNDVRDRVSKSMFKKFCVNNFIVKAGKAKIVTVRKDERGFNARYINNWKLDVAHVKRYVND
jgi:hypothetical protein